MRKENTQTLRDLGKGVLLALFCALLILLSWKLAPAGARVDGSKAVTSAGTAERLAADQTFACWVVIQAKTGNTGSVFIGASTIDSTRGTELTPGASYSEGGRSSCSKTVRLNLGATWIDAAVNGEGVTFHYVAWP